MSEGKYFQNSSTREIGELRDELRVMNKVKVGEVCCLTISSVL